MPRRGYPPTQGWRTFLRNQAFAIGTISLGEAGRLTDELLALVRGWIARVVPCATKVRPVIGTLVEPSSPLQPLRPHRSSNRTDWRAPPTALGGDNWTMAGRRLSAYRSRASPRRKRAAYTNFARPSLWRARAKRPTVPTSRFVLHVRHEQLAQQLMILMPLPYPAALPRVGHGGQGYEESQLPRRRILRAQCSGTRTCRVRDGAIRGPPATGQMVGTPSCCASW
jgi:hypothetical protein